MRISRSTLAVAAVSGGLTILLAGGPGGAVAAAAVPVGTAHPTAAQVQGQAPQSVATPLPAQGGGDQDADDNGGPDDGDGPV